MTLLNIFGGGLFILPLLLIGGAAWFFAKAKSKQKKGSEWVDGRGATHYDPLRKAPLYTSWDLWYGVALLLACILIVSKIIADA